MKLQLQNTPFIDNIRNEKTFRTPRNIILKLLIFAGIFYLMQLAETICIFPFLLPRVFDWARQQTEANGGSLSSEETMDAINAIAADPANVWMMLFCTVGGTILVLLYCRIVEGRRLHTLGFCKKGAFVQYLIGLGLGFAAFTLTLLVDMLMGGVRFEGFSGSVGISLLLVFIGFLLQGMSEEVLCRGFMLTATLRDHNVWWAILVNSILFGAFHFMNDGFGVLAMLNITICGILFSLLMLRTQNIWICGAFHGVWNFVQGNFYGLPVSGIDSGDTVFRCTLTDVTLATGGDFGLEASLGCTIVLGIGCLLLLFVPGFSKKQDAAAPSENA